MCTELNLLEENWLKIVSKGNISWRASLSRGKRTEDELAEGKPGRGLSHSPRKHGAENIVDVLDNLVYIMLCVSLMADPARILSGINMVFI